MHQWIAVFKMPDGRFSAVKQGVEPEMILEALTPAEAWTFGDVPEEIQTLISIRMAVYNGPITKL